MRSSSPPEPLASRRPRHAADEPTEPSRAERVTLSRSLYCAAQIDRGFGETRDSSSRAPLSIWRATPLHRWTKQWLFDRLIGWPSARNRQTACSSSCRFVPATTVTVSHATGNRCPRRVFLPEIQSEVSRITEPSPRKQYESSGSASYSCLSSGCATLATANGGVRTEGRLRLRFAAKRISALSATLRPHTESRKTSM